MVVAVAVTVAFTLAGMAFSQLNLGSRNHAILFAKNAAESAINDAISRMLVSKMDFGTNSAHGVRFVDPNGAVGVVAFNSTSTERVGLEDIPIARSTHNWTREGTNAAVQGHNSRIVPKDAVHLVGTGIFGGVVRRIECIVHFPNFNYAIAANGPVTVQNALIAGVRREGGVRVVDGAIVVDQSKLEAGNIVSNAGTTAISLETGTRVTGDAQAPGLINVAPSAHIQGEVRSGADPLVIPDIDINEFDPSENQFTQTLENGSVGTRVEGYAIAEGDVNIQGDLRLENGLVFIKGNAVINGGVVGTGALFVTGSAHLRGANNVSGDDGIAVVTGGDLIMQGAGREASFLQGLVYSKGNFVASRVTIVGAFVQNKAAGSFVVNDANVISAPTRAASYAFAPYDRAVGADFAAFDPNGKPIPPERLQSVARNVHDIYYSPENQSAPQPRQPQQIQQEIFQPSSPQYLNPSGLSGDALTDYCHTHMMLSIATRKMGDGKDHVVITIRFHGRADAGRGADGSDASLTRDLLPGSPWANYPTEGIPEAAISILEFQGPVISPDGHVDEAELERLFDTIAQGQAAHMDFLNKDKGSFGGPFSTANLKQNLRHFFQLARMGPNANKPVANFRYDPNDFLSLADKMRVLFWREIP